MLKIITLTKDSNISSCAAIDNTLNFHVGCPGFDSRRWKRFVFFFGPFVFGGVSFRKTHFHVLKDLKYTGKLIAGLLPAFISKIQ